ncbi:MAG: hypothetical protein ACK5V6_04190 [Pseudanabaena sp.]|jgi:hypothetical protein|nr:hypothetical protein [Pseudanabaena sp. M007S1SP1A06QC]
MTPEEKERLEACTREIAEILYRNAEAKDAEQLKTLEGIEIAVREQMLENVSANVGIFLSKKAVGQKQGKKENYKAALVNSNWVQKQPLAEIFSCLGDGHDGI